MKKDSKLSATALTERSRNTTRLAMAREVLYGAMLARLWPSYITAALPTREPYNWLLCVRTPQGMMTWRLDEDDKALLSTFLDEQSNAGERAEDRTAVLLHLASEGW